MNITRRPFSIAELHAEVRGQFSALTQDLVTAYETNSTEFRFEPFEGLRGPDRQNHLFAERTSKASAWQSAHQFGLAVDFVPKILKFGPEDDIGRWHWYWPDASHGDWVILGELAEKHGLKRDIDWDKPHVEHPHWKAIRKVWKLA